MALEISKISNYGVEATYWKITITNINWLIKKASIIIYGFRDKTNRDNFSLPLIQINYNFEESIESDGTVKVAFPFIAEDNIVSKSYELIKEMPEFKGANNV